MLNGWHTVVSSRSFDRLTPTPDNKSLHWALSMTACGRKRTLVLPDFEVSERPLWRKADIPEWTENFHKIDQLGTSAFHAKAAVRLESVKRSANDPKRPKLKLVNFVKILGIFRNVRFSPKRTFRHAKNR